MTSYSIVVIGTSAGGLHALSVLLGGLPPTFDLPIVIVQHRSVSSHDLASVLQDCTKLNVEEAEDKVILVDGHVYLAPPDYHVLVGPGELSLTTDEPVRFSRPSIDLLFESAADAYGKAVVGVILTGANQDGCRGSTRIAEAGGTIIVQDPGTAESQTMPLAVARSVPTARTLPLEQIADALAQLATGDTPTGMRA
jgi:two-component system, chemotaxis family, protein-glutamate methylesterase/glutaminase